MEGDRVVGLSDGESDGAKVGLTEGEIVGLVVGIEVEGLSVGIFVVGAPVSQNRTSEYVPYVYQDAVGPDVSVNMS